MNFTYNGEEMFLQIGEYPGGSPKINVISEMEGPYASLGKPSFPVLDNGLVVIDDSFEPQKALVDAMVEKGILTPTESKHQSGFSEFGVYKLNDEEPEEDNTDMQSSISTNPLD